MKREISNLGDWWTISTKMKRIKKKIIQDQKMKKRGRPRLSEQKKNTKREEDDEDIKEYYKYKLEDKIYYDFQDILSFLKDECEIDYEDPILNDEEKQEFKTKLNFFFKTNIK